MVDSIPANINQCILVAIQHMQCATYARERHNACKREAEHMRGRGILQRVLAARGGRSGLPISQPHNTLIPVYGLSPPVAPDGLDPPDAPEPLLKGQSPCLLTPP